MSITGDNIENHYIQDRYTPYKSGCPTITDSNISVPSFSVLGLNRLSFLLNFELPDKLICPGYTGL